MPTVYVVTNEACHTCRDFKLTTEDNPVSPYEQVLHGIRQIRGVTLLTHHGKSWSDPLPSNFPHDIARLSNYVPAIIYVPDNPNISKNGMILNASVYGMDIDPRGNIQPSGSMTLQAKNIIDWVKHMMASSSRSMVGTQSKQVRTVHTSGTDGPVIPPVTITKL